MIARVDGNAGNSAEDPTVRQRLGPGGIDAESGHLRCRHGAFLRERSSRCAGDCNSEHGVSEEMATHQRLSGTSLHRLRHGRRA